MADVGALGLLENQAADSGGRDASTLVYSRIGPLVRAGMFRQLSDSDCGIDHRFRPSRRIDDPRILAPGLGRSGVRRSNVWTVSGCCRQRAGLADHFAPSGFIEITFYHTGFITQMFGVRPKGM